MSVPKSHLVANGLAIPCAFGLWYNIYDAVNATYDFLVGEAASNVFVGLAIVLLYGLFALFLSILPIVTFCMWKSGEYDKMRYRLPRPVTTQLQRFQKLPAREDMSDADQLARIIADTDVYFSGDYPIGAVQSFVDDLDDAYASVVERRAVKDKPTHFPDAEQRVQELDAAVAAYEEILAAAMRTRNTDRGLRMRETSERLQMRAKGRKDIEAA